MRFENRIQAGKLLAKQLKHLAGERPLVLALPRGGTPIAAEVARALKGDLDLLLVKKLGMPGQAELAAGAIAEDGEPVWNETILSRADLSKATLESLVEQKRKELREQSVRLRGERAPFRAEGRVVILVDDGLATGATMRAAVELLKTKNPRRVVIAVPVGAKDTVEELRPLVDEMVVLQIPETFWAVGQWYVQFDQVSDEEVKGLLLGKKPGPPGEEDVRIPDGRTRLGGTLAVPANARGLIVFAHGSGSSRLSPRNRRVAEALRKAGFATLLFDLLTENEAADRRNVFRIDFLARRLRIATDWVRGRLSGKELPIGYFGASTGAAAALMAAAEDEQIFAVVSRGGRPDLAGEELAKVKAPTLLLVGDADIPVIPLNSEAAAALPSARLVLIPGAGHLFEEPGALESVTEYAVDWFNQCLGASASPTPSPEEELTAELRTAVRPLREASDLDSLVKTMSERRVVMLGEATHGTEEFYALRREISRRLIENYGFRFIAVEGDWPDCYQLHRYLAGRSAAATAREIMSAFGRWPSWMWANHQVADMIEELKDVGAGFYGLDVYSLYESLVVLKSYAAKMDRGLADRIDAVYACFEPYEKNEIRYAARSRDGLDLCEEQTVECLREMMRARLERTSLDGDELFDARQNALVLQSAERYYRTMGRGDEVSWNIRDEHMMDTLDRLLRHHGEGARAVVWAHNTHIGDYKATDMVEQGYVNLGGLARERYGAENVYLLGFGTYQGTVLAGSAWDARPEVMTMPPARPGSLEASLHELATNLEVDGLWFETKGDRPLPALSFPRGHRAIGVVYRPDAESRGHNYVPTDLAARYDGFVFVDRTEALRPLQRIPGAKGLIPENWPMGQ